MKKIIALLLAVVMVMGLATVVSANADVTAPDYTEFLDKEIVLPKEYQVNNGTAPAETFTFTFTGESYKNNEGKTVEGATIPAIANQTIEFDAISADTEKTVKIKIDPTKYELGVYTYKVEEVIPEDGAKTAGTTYDEEPMYLVLTILRDEKNGKHYVAAMHYQKPDGSKDEGFVNEYDAGQLTVTKTITGNMADMTKKFPFTITFTAPEGEIIKSKIKIEVGGIDGFELWVPGVNSASYTNSIGHGESIVITNIPEGVTYEITEDKGEYTQTEVTGEKVEKGTVTGTIEANAKDTAAYTNDLTSKVDTGIVMDSVPFIVMAVVAVIGLAAFTAKKRVQE